jgi:glutamate-5-semialdehyde dehydrogenase
MIALALAELAISSALAPLYSLLSVMGLSAWLGDAYPADAAISIVAKLLSCALVTYFVLQRGREGWRNLGWVGFKPVILVFAFAPLIAGVTIFLSEIDNLLRAYLPSTTLDNWNTAPELDSLMSTAWLGPALAVVIAPLTEEIIFRGVILRGLLGRWRPWIAITASALLFALMHLNPAQTPVALILGLLLGWVYARTRSLGLCILGHALNNAASYPIEFLPFEVQGFNFTPEDLPADVVLFQPWWFDLLGLAFFLVGLWIIHRYAPARTPWVVPPPPEPPLLRSTALPPSLPPRLSGNSAINGDCLPASVADTQPSMSAELVTLVTSLGQRARAASLVLANVPTAAKNAALDELARLIEVSHASLLAANALDLASSEAAALSPASRDRLTLNAARLTQLAQSVREVSALPDPVGALLDETIRPNGLRIRKVRVPIGVIGIIYESRPNVTVDCAILCLKSGNASILRGGKECFHTNTALAALIQQALATSGLPADAVQLVPTTDRAALTALLKLDTYVHCIIPRGGEGLIRFVAQNSTIPVIKHYKGVCFVYVDAAADLAMAEALTLNAKVSRPSACNSAEQLLVHRSVAEKFLPSVARALRAKNVELRCDAASAAILAAASAPNSDLRSPISESAASGAIPYVSATEADFSTEFLDYVIAIRIVDSLEGAIAIINRDSSNHSDAIVTADEPAARRFLAEVDSATVFWNASTRFNDGFEFGFGAEIGISTDRLHARGPMGLPELCSYKYLIEGTGQVRG